MTDTPLMPDGNRNLSIDLNMDMIIPGLYLGKLGLTSLLHVLSSILVELLFTQYVFPEKRISIALAWNYTYPVYNTG